MAKIVRKGSGKTKGSGSFVRVKLSELNRVYNHSIEHPNETALIVVSRRFAEMADLETQPFVATTKNVEAHTERMDFVIKH
jgi:hypothetical protein